MNEKLYQYITGTISRIEAKKWEYTSSVSVSDLLRSLQSLRLCIDKLYRLSTKEQESFSWLLLNCCKLIYDVAQPLIWTTSGRYATESLIFAEIAMEGVINLCTTRHFRFRLKLFVSAIYAMLSQNNDNFKEAESLLQYCENKFVELKDREELDDRVPEEIKKSLQEYSVDICVMKACLKFWKEPTTLDLDEAYLIATFRFPDMLIQNIPHHERVLCECIRTNQLAASISTNDSMKKRNQGILSAVKKVSQLAPTWTSYTRLEVASVSLFENHGDNSLGREVYSSMFPSILEDERKSNNDVSADSSTSVKPDSDSPTALLSSSISSTPAGFEIEMITSFGSLFYPASSEVFDLKNVNNLKGLKSQLPSWIPPALILVEKIGEFLSTRESRWRPRQSLLSRLTKKLWTEYIHPYFQLLLSSTADKVAFVRCTNSTPQLPSSCSPIEALIPLLEGISEAFHSTLYDFPLIQATMSIIYAQLLRAVPGNLRVAISWIQSSLHLLQEQRRMRSEWELFQPEDIRDVAALQRLTFSCRNDAWDWFQAVKRLGAQAFAGFGIFGSGSKSQRWETAFAEAQADLTALYFRSELEYELLQKKVKDEYNNRVQSSVSLHLIENAAGKKSSASSTQVAGKSNKKSKTANATTSLPSSMSTKGKTDTSGTTASSGSSSSSNSIESLSIVNRLKRDLKKDFYGRVILWLEMSRLEESPVKRKEYLKQAKEDLEECEVREKCMKDAFGSSYFTVQDPEKPCFPRILARSDRFFYVVPVVPRRSESEDSTSPMKTRSSIEGERPSAPVITSYSILAKEEGSGTAVSLSNSDFAGCEKKVSAKKLTQSLNMNTLVKIEGLRRGERYTFASVGYGYKVTKKNSLIKNGLNSTNKSLTLEGPESEGRGEGIRDWDDYDGMDLLASDDEREYFSEKEILLSSTLSNSSFPVEAVHPLPLELLWCWYSLTCAALHHLPFARYAARKLRAMFFQPGPQEEVDRSLSIGTGVNLFWCPWPVMSTLTLHQSSPVLLYYFIQTSYLLEENEATKSSTLAPDSIAEGVLSEQPLNEDDVEEDLGMIDGNHNSLDSSISAFNSPQEVILHWNLKSGRQLRGLTSLQWLALTVQIACQLGHHGLIFQGVWQAYGIFQALLGPDLESEGQELPLAGALQATLHYFLAALRCIPREDWREVEHRLHARLTFHAVRMALYCRNSCRSVTSFMDDFLPDVLKGNVESVTSTMSIDNFEDYFSLFTSSDYVKKLLQTSSYVEQMKAVFSYSAPSVTSTYSENGSAEEKSKSLPEDDDAKKFPLGSFWKNSQYFQFFALRGNLSKLMSDDPGQTASLTTPEGVPIMQALLEYSSSYSQVLRAILFMLKEAVQGHENAIGLKVLEKFPLYDKFFAPSLQRDLQLWRFSFIQELPSTGLSLTSATSQTAPSSAKGGAKPGKGGKSDPAPAKGGKGGGAPLPPADNPSTDRDTSQPTKIVPDRYEKVSYEEMKSQSVALGQICQLICTLGYPEAGERNHFPEGLKQKNRMKKLEDKKQVDGGPWEYFDPNKEEDNEDRKGELSQSQGNHGSELEKAKEIKDEGLKTSVPSVASSLSRSDYLRYSCASIVFFSRHEKLLASISSLTRFWNFLVNKWISPRNFAMQEGGNSGVTGSSSNTSPMKNLVLVTCHAVLQLYEKLSGLVPPPSEMENEAVPISTSTVSVGSSAPISAFVASFPFEEGKEVPGKEKKIRFSESLEAETSSPVRAREGRNSSSSVEVSYSIKSVKEGLLASRELFIYLLKVLWLWKEFHGEVVELGSRFMSLFMQLAPEFSQVVGEHCWKILFHAQQELVFQAELHRSRREKILKDFIADYEEAQKKKRKKKLRIARLEKDEDEVKFERERDRLQDLLAQAENAFQSRELRLDVLHTQSSKYDTLFSTGMQLLAKLRESMKNFLEKCESTIQKSQMDSQKRENDLSMTAESALGTEAKKVRISDEVGLIEDSSSSSSFPVEIRSYRQCIEKVESLSDEFDDLIDQFNQLADFAREKKDLKTLSLCLKDQGDLYLLFRYENLATKIWQDALDGVFNVLESYRSWSSVCQNLRQQLSTLSRQTTGVSFKNLHIERLNLILPMIVILGKLCRFGSHQNFGDRSHYARFAAELCQILFLECGSHPQSKVGFAAYICRFLGGPSPFSLRHESLSSFALSQALEEVLECLKLEGFYIEALPVVVLLEHLHSSYTFHAPSWLKARLVRVECLLRLHLFAQGISMFSSIRTSIISIMNHTFSNILMSNEISPYTQTSTLKIEDYEMHENGLLFHGMKSFSNNQGIESEMNKESMKWLLTYHQEIKEFLSQYQGELPSSEDELGGDSSAKKAEESVGKTTNSGAKGTGNKKGSISVPSDDGSSGNNTKKLGRTKALFSPLFREEVTHLALQFVVEMCECDTRTSSESFSLFQEALNSVETQVQKSLDMLQGESTSFMATFLASVGDISKQTTTSSASTCATLSDFDSCPSNSFFQVMKLYLQGQLLRFKSFQRLRKLRESRLLGLQLLSILHSEPMKHAPHFFRQEIIRNWMFIRDGLVQIGLVQGRWDEVIFMASENLKESHYFSCPYYIRSAAFRRAQAYFFQGKYDHALQDLLFLQERSNFFDVKDMLLSGAFQLEGNIYRQQSWETLSSFEALTLLKKALKCLRQARTLAENVANSQGFLGADCNLTFASSDKDPSQSSLTHFQVWPETLHQFTHFHDNTPYLGVGSTQMNGKKAIKIGGKKYEDFLSWESSAVFGGGQGSCRVTKVGQSVRRGPVDGDVANFLVKSPFGNVFLSPVRGLVSIHVGLSEVLEELRGLKRGNPNPSGPPIPGGESKVGLKSVKESSSEALNSEDAEDEKQEDSEEVSETEDSWLKEEIEVNENGLKLLRYVAYCPLIWRLKLLLFVSKTRLEEYHQDCDSTLNESSIISPLTTALQLAVQGCHPWPVMVDLAQQLVECYGHADLQSLLSIAPPQRLRTAAHYLRLATQLTTQWRLLENRPLEIIAGDPMFQAPLDPSLEILVAPYLGACLGKKNYRSPGAASSSSAPNATGKGAANAPAVGTTTSGVTGRDAIFLLSSLWRESGSFMLEDFHLALRVDLLAGLKKFYPRFAQLCLVSSIPTGQEDLIMPLGSLSTYWTGVVTLPEHDSEDGGADGLGGGVRDGKNPRDGRSITSTSTTSTAAVSTTSTTAFPSSSSSSSPSTSTSGSSVQDLYSLYELSTLYLLVGPLVSMSTPGAPEASAGANKKGGAASSSTPATSGGPPALMQVKINRFHAFLCEKAVRDIRFQYVDASSKGNQRKIWELAKKFGFALLAIVEIFRDSRLRGLKSGSSLMSLVDKMDPESFFKSAEKMKAMFDVVWGEYNGQQMWIIELSKNLFGAASSSSSDLIEGEEAPMKVKVPFTEDCMKVLADVLTFQVACESSVQREVCSFIRSILHLE